MPSKGFDSVGTILAIVIIFGGINIFETIYFMKEGTTKFGNSLFTLWLLWGVSLTLLIGFYFTRRHLQRKYTTLIKSKTTQRELSFNEQEYIYQMPLIKLVDRMPIQILGHREFSFQLYFNNRWQKFITLFDIINMGGLHMSSTDSNIVIQPIEPFKLTNQFIYDVYLNNDYIGRLQSKKLLKEQGLKKYLNFTFSTKQDTITIQNDYLSTDLYMLNHAEERIFHATRNYFTLEKDQLTDKRGERHDVTVLTDQIQDEVLLAIYVQLINIKNF